MKSVRSVLRGNLLIFTFGDALRHLSLFITFPFFSLYIQTLGGSMVDIGLVNSLRPLAGFFLFPVAGYLADRYSRVKIIAVSGYINAALYLIFALSPDWRFLALGNFLMGLMIFQFPAMNALMADSLPSKRRGVGYSIWIAIPSAVGILSPYLGGYLITVLGVESAMRLLYWWSVVTITTIATMNLRFLTETKPERSWEHSESGFTRILADSYADTLYALRSLPRTLKAYALMLTFSFFANSLTAPYWVVYGVENLGLSEIQWGTILLIAAVVNVLLLVPAGWVVDQIGARKALSFALLLSSAPIFLFPFSRGFTDATLLFLAMTVANTFLTSGAPAYMAQSVPAERKGQLMAALGQGMLFINTRGGQGGPGMGAVLTVPLVLGSVLGGFIYTYDPKLPWILLGFSMLINFLICLVFLTPTKSE